MSSLEVCLQWRCVFFYKETLVKGKKLLFIIMIIFMLSYGEYVIFFCVCVYLSVYMYVCVSVCVYIVCVCVYIVCVCVCVKASKYIMCVCVCE